MIVGRELELGILNTQYEKMHAGNGSVLFLTGEAGLGKTTLVHEWRMRIQDGEMRAEESSKASSSSLLNSLPSPLFLESACSIPIGNVDVGRLEALQPWADIIGGISDFESRNSETSDHESLSEIRNSKSEIGQKNKIDLKKLIHDAAPSWAWAIPFVGDLAHAALETSRLIREQRDTTPLEQISNATNQQQVFQQYVNLLTKVSETFPLIIFLDDMHWADTSSCNLLFYLSRQIADKKILVIATYRDDDALQANDGKGHAIITIKNEILRYKTGTEHKLSYLDVNAITAILQKSFPSFSSIASLSSSTRFVHWLRKISDGNSLFVTQFIETLKEDGHLDSNGNFIGDYNMIAIPPTALAVVEERTRRLDPGTRELLMFATAEGEEFTSYVLERLAERKPMELLKELQRATAQGLIVDKGTARTFANKTTTIFGFSHALFHKALYDQLVSGQKILLHQQCFELLKAEWDRATETQQRSTTLGAKLLTHAEKCEEWSAAADVALALAKQSANNSAPDEALEMCAKCLEYVSHTGDENLRAEIKFLEGNMLLRVSRYEEALTALHTAQKLFEQQGYEERAIEAMNGLLSARYRQSRFEEAFALGTEMLERSERAQYRKGILGGLNSLGNFYLKNGDYPKALGYYSRCQEILDAQMNEPVQAVTFCNFGTVFGSQGNYSLALEYFMRSLALHESTGDRNAQLLVLGNIGLSNFFLGNFECAMEYQLRSLKISESLGDRKGQAVALSSIGLIQNSMGNYPHALEFSLRSLAIALAIGNKSGEATARTNIGTTYANLGERHKALESLTQSLAISETIGDREAQVVALTNIGSTYRQLRDFENGKAALEKCLALATESGIIVFVGFANGELGRIAELEAEALTGEERAAHLRNAVSHLQRAVNVYHETQYNQLKAFEEELQRVGKLLNAEEK